MMFRIKELRTRYGFSQKDVAERLVNPEAPPTCGSVLDIAAFRHFLTHWFAVVYG